MLIFTAYQKYVNILKNVGIDFTILQNRTKYAFPLCGSRNLNTLT